MKFWLHPCYSVRYYALQKSRIVWIVSGEICSLSIQSWSKIEKRAGRTDLSLIYSSALQSVKYLSEENIRI